MKVAFRQLLEQAPLGPFQLVTVALVMLVLMIDGIDIQLLSLIAPVIIDEWGIDRAQFGPALAAALFGMSVGAFAGGWIGDRFGRLNALVGSTILFGAATTMAAAADSVVIITILRMVSGIGFGAAGPNGLALASDWLSERHRPQVISMLSVGTPAGGMIGAMLAILLLPIFGWRGAFIACGGATILFALFLAMVLRESPGYLLAHGRDADGRKAASVLLKPGDSLVPDDLGRGHPHTKQRVTLFDLSLLRFNIGAGLAFFCAALVAYGFLAWTPVFLTDAGFSLPQALTAVFAFNLASVIAALGSGFLVSWFGSRKVLATSCALLCCSIVALGIVLEPLANTALPMRPSDVERVATTLLVGAAGGTAGAAIATIYAMMASGYPLGCRAVGLGFGLMLGRTGGIVLSLGGGYLLNASGVSLWPFMAVLAGSAAMAGVGALIADLHIAGRATVLVRP